MATHNKPGDNVFGITRWVKKNEILILIEKEYVRENRGYLYIYLAGGSVLAGCASGVACDKF